MNGDTHAVTIAFYTL